MTEIVIDISRYQAGNPPKAIDFRKMKAAGVTAVKVRTGIGNWYTDPEAKNFIDAIRAADLLVGAYHVVHPKHSPTSTVDRAYSALVGLNDGRDLDLPWTVDAEIKGETVGGVYKEFPKQQINDVSRGVTELFLRRDGRRPEFYSNWGYIEYNFPSQRDWLLDYNLHLSYYYEKKPWDYFMTLETPTLSRPSDRIPEPYLSAWRSGRIPRPYILWQGTDNAPGAMFGAHSGNIDVSVPWRGLNYADFYKPVPQTPATLSDKEKLDWLWEIAKEKGDLDTYAQPRAE